MKQLFRCDYCDFTGTEQEVCKHERECPKNHTLKGCMTCKHCSQMATYVTCKLGKEIEEGKYIVNCSSYDRGEPSDDSPFSKIVGKLFGGL